MAKKPELKDYVAIADGWVAGARVKKGATVRLTEEQAKYEPVAAPGAAKGKSKEASS